MVDRFPPAEEVEQSLSIAAKSKWGQSAEAFHIEVTVYPIDLAAGRLLDDAEGTAGGIGGGLLEHAEGHGLAPSSSAWNWRALPPALKKLLGSWLSGRATSSAVTP
jgi:hypothetical protein